MDGSGGWWLLSAAAAAALASWLFNALVRFVWRPLAVARHLRAQSVQGFRYSFSGDGSLRNVRRLRAAGAGLTLDIGDHDYTPIVQPQFRKWIPLYGRVFLYWFGSTPNLCVAELAMVKQVLGDRRMFPKQQVSPAAQLMLRGGLLRADGEEWQRHRKIVHPAFKIDKLKMMTSTMVDRAHSMVERWEMMLATEEKKGCKQVEIELSSQFEELTADVISHTAFGSSYNEGKLVFAALKELQLIISSTLFNVHIPGLRYLPTQKNRRVWKLDKEVKGTLMQIITNRLTAAKDVAGYGSDLLGLMLEACIPEHGGSSLLSMDEIVGECKTFFFAGHESTSHLLTWTMFLLSTHPEWQDKLRNEVVRECGGMDPTHEQLNKMKLVNMFLLETLRLYSPLPFMRRRARSAVQLGGVTVPEGTILTIPIAMMHRDEEVWGEDAGQFNPLRFDGGGRKHLGALLSFSMGPRACIGQNFAMLETRAVVAAILQRFTLELSPKYVHAPTDVITLRPKYGLPMIIRSV